jgi:hypothetical protein
MVVFRGGWFVLLAHRLLTSINIDPIPWVSTGYLRASGRLFVSARNPYPLGDNRMSMKQTLMKPPSLIGAERFGRVGACRKATGLSPHELQVVVAVMSCEIADGAFPTRAGIMFVSRVDDESMPSRLKREGWLEPAGREGNVIAYRATDKAWERLGFERAARRVA